MKKEQKTIIKVIASESEAQELAIKSRELGLSRSQYIMLLLRAKLCSEF
jgi:hypothetical protein